MSYLKVEGHPNLIRDKKTQAILSADMNEYENYMKMRKTKETESKRIEDLEKNVILIKDDLQEIKNLLKGLADGSK